MLGVNNNIGNLRAQDAMSFNHAKLQVALERLSTGIRVNRAEDDASGLILRDRFQAQVGGLEEGIRNIQTAQGMIQVAEEGINKITDSLQQMRQLAVRAADDNLTDKDRSDIQVQITMLLKEVNDRAEKTSYNGHKVLSGEITEAVEERRSTAEVQTNSFLRDGTSLFDIDLQYTTNATTFGAVSQGSYEVKLVYSADRFEGAVASTNTSIAGAGPATTAVLNVDDATVVTSQVVRDRAGIAHNVTITFTQTNATTWDYDVAGDQTGAWTTALAGSGTLTFNADGTVLSGPAFAATIADGTVLGQAYGIDFSDVRVNTHTATATAPTGAQSGGAAGSPSTDLALTASFITGGAMATTVTTLNLTDARGATHSVTVTLAYVSGGTGGTGLDETWTYTIDKTNAPYWDGSGDANLTGTVVFDALGDVATIGGVATSVATMTIGDPGSDQTVSLDLSAFHMAGATVALSAVETGGVAGTITDTLDVAGNVVDGDGPYTFTVAGVDRPGYIDTDFDITLTQSGSSNDWDISVALSTTSAFTSVDAATVSFDDAGNATNVTLTVNLAGGGTTTMTLDAADLTMGRASTLSNSTTDGSAGTGPVQVDAAIYWTDGGSAPAIVSTMYDVSGSQVSYKAGGVCLTVNTVSTYDAGLVGYGKTLTYLSATTEDNALQFQTGADEGEVFRVGIQKMTVETLFRRDHYVGESGDPGFGTYTADTFGSISLATTLQAQDLIGQIDDALRIVGRANLKVGAFKNEFDRTLDQQRSNHTQMTNAYANVNDADMAVEATAQSKRNILIQSGTAMIAQANQSAQFILQLLR